MKANTFSICAVDPDRRMAGVAVASRALAVGAMVPWAEPGVGAVATQAMVNTEYGPAALALLRKGVPAAEVVERLVGADLVATDDDPAQRRTFEGEGMTDEGVDFVRDAGVRLVWFAGRMRQLAVVDREGRAAVHTGERTQPWAGGLTGDGFSCQGNLLAGAAVVEAMAEAFQRERRNAPTLVGPLAAALTAGDNAGGDRRGKQAAAILVVRERGHWSGSDRWCDLRVDDHDDPVGELRRILDKVGFMRAEV